jgi:death-on-curing protein
VIFLEPEFIAYINKYMVLRFGGAYFAADDNLRDRGTLEYLVEIVQHLADDCRDTPPVYLVAAEYAHRIITRHVFHDGNKRTGMEAMLVCLRSNGKELAIDPMSDDLQSIALDVAEGRAGVPELIRWIEERLGPPSR